MKKIVSVVLVITLALNIFGFDVLNSRASAEPVSTVVFITGGLIMGVLGGLLGTTIVNVGTELSNTDHMVDRVNWNAIQSGEVIQIKKTTYSGSDVTNYEIVPVSGLSGDELEEVQFICDYINNCDHLDMAIAGFMAENGDVTQNLYHPELKAELYEQVKTDAVNAYTAYIEAKEREIAFTDYENTIAALSEALGHEWDPAYSFSFVGPLTPVQFAGKSEATSLQCNGFTFLPPHVLSGVNTGFAPPVFDYYGDACNFGNYIIELTDHGKFKGVCTFSDPVSFTSYILYNNELFVSNIYYKNTTWVESLQFINQGGWFNSHKNKDGISINNSVTQYYNNGTISFSDVVYIGFAYNTTNSTANFTFSSVNDDVTLNDFAVEGEGDSVDIPLSDDEQAVKAGIASGILSTDSTLTLNPDGTIASADGITIEQLQAIAQELGDSQLKQFDSIETYLAYISALLEKANVDSGTISDVLNGLRSLEQSQTNYLDQINANIASIADTLTMEGEIEKTDEDLSVVVAEHTGLAEANSFVSRWTLVNQCKGLLYNVLDENRYSSKPPSFVFYWDSNRDGVKEEYTALDLSFMENMLTNENLADKDRFTTPMTVRQFIQMLMIFICYFAFVIKLLRKLPGLLSGGESAAGDGLEIKNIERNEAIKSLKG